MTDVDHLEAAKFWLGVGPHGDGEADPLPAIAHALIAIAERMTPPAIIQNIGGQLDPEQIREVLTKARPHPDTF